MAIVMKHIVYFLFIRLASAALVIAFVVGCQTTENIRTPSPADTASTNGALNVMSFNIRLGLGQDEPKGDIYRMRWGLNLNAVIAAIRAENPDIVGLQEVAGITQMQDIAKALNMNYAFEWHQTGSTRPRWWGVGILTKYPIVTSRGAQISWGRGNIRHISVATISTPSGNVTAVSIHKDKDLKDGLSFHQIMKEIEHETFPILLIGDLNVLPDDPRLAPFHIKFTDTARAAPTETAKYAEQRGTFFASRKRRIDYIFAEKGKFDVLDAYLSKKEHHKASDHIAYLSRVALKK